MEDLLTKSIFNEKDLNRLAPDFCPPDVTLRMQERRNRYKFNTSNRSNLSNNSWNRKTMKNDYKINSEIVNIRNTFHNTNLRNEIMIRDNIRRDRNQFELNRFSNDLLIKDLKALSDDTDNCIRDIQEDIDNLILHNANEFKLYDKPKVEKAKVESQQNKLKTLPLTHKFNINKENRSQYDIKVECTYGNNTADKTDDSISFLSPTARVYENDEAVSRNGLDSHVKDLQTLLIMMAISKPTNDDELQVPSSTPEVLEVPKEIKNVATDFKTYSPVGDVSASLTIVPLKTALSEKNNNIAKRVLYKWKNYVLRKKETMNNQRKEALNTFFDKLTKKKMEVLHSETNNKAKTVVRDYETYQHRYKIQKHIIALQKAKLEDQNRVIEELKYNKIIEASRQSVDAMKDEVIKSYYEIDRQLKPKIKCLTNELKLNDIEEPSLVLHCLKVPKFLQRMEKRAREREEKHALIRERRRQMEEERIRLKQQADLAKSEMDREDKLQRIQYLREKRKQEKIVNIRRKQHVERIRALIVMADLHYEKNLTIKYGIKPFRMLLQMKRENMEKAKLHHEFQLKKNVFLNWMWHTEDMWYERNYKAEDFHRKKILRKALDGFKQNFHEYTLRRQVAEDYYDLFVMQHVFRKFRAAIQIVKKQNEAKWRKAVIYYNSNLLFKVFTSWSTLPALNALLREQEARKARWREKVLLVVPDYNPPDD